MEPGNLVSRYESAGPYVNSYINTESFSRLTLDAILDSGEEYGSHPPRNMKVVLEHTSTNPTGPIHVGRARNPILGDTLVRIMRKAGYDVSSEFYINDVGKQVVMLAWGVMNLSEKEEDGTLEKMDGKWKVRGNKEGKNEENGQGNGSDGREENGDEDSDELKEMWNVRLAAMGEEKADHLFVKYYRKACELYETDTEVKDEIDLMLQRLERGDPSVKNHIEVIVEKMLEGMLSSLEKINIGIDTFIWESDFLSNRKVHEVVDRLKETQWCKEDDGAFYLEIESFAPGQEKYYLTRSDGTTLYTARDIAYHLDKFERCDLAVNVLGEDQKLGMSALKAGLKMLDMEKEPENVFYSFVSLPEGRMSTRKGIVVHLDDLVEEIKARAVEEIRKRRTDLGEEDVRSIAKTVGIGALRYNIIKVQAEKPIVFRWNEALNFEGNSAPFIQYAHARCHGILSKALENGGSGIKGEFETSKLTHENEMRLVEHLSKFPGIILECAEMRKAHSLASYAFELASTFNQFYRDCPVLTADEDLRTSRMALVESTKVVLGSSLAALGIESPNTM
jgi:arginyl-tRNA synthetase